MRGLRQHFPRGKLGKKNEARIRRAANIPDQRFWTYIEILDHFKRELNLTYYSVGTVPKENYEEALQLSFQQRGVERKG